MLKTVKRKRTIAYSKTRPSKTIPDQSMDIKELVRRFVKGIPVDVVQREKVYIDQSDLDLEKLSRLDAADRAFQAQEMRDNNAYLWERVKQAKQAQADASAAQERSRKAESEAQNRTGIDTLDNTMPVDTGLDSSQLRGQKNSKSKN